MGLGGQTGSFQNVRGTEVHAPEQLFFPFLEKRVVQVSCLALFFIYIHVGLRVFMQCINFSSLELFLRCLYVH